MGGAALSLFLPSKEQEHIARGQNASETNFMDQPYQALVTACQAQEAHAQRELYDLFAPKMMAVCLRYGKNQMEAEDMLQEGFIKVFQKIDRYQFHGSLEGWIRRIIIHTAIDVLRKEKPFTHQLPIDEHLSESLDSIDPDQLELEYLFQIIQDLPPGYRLVFNLYALEGFSHQEIGEQLGIAPSTSRSQYTRARAMLMQRIKEDRQAINRYDNVH